ncbi:hypothetical protein [Bradyrhizobium sp. USDA 10063]
MAVPLDIDQFGVNRARVASSNTFLSRHCFLAGEFENGGSLDLWDAPVCSVAVRTRSVWMEAAFTHIDLAAR